MAIYSCSHSAVGRTTHAAGTAGAHAGYVTRENAARSVVGEHMPLDRAGSRAWLDGQEAADRKNARMIDKVLVALPIELNAAERVQLVRDFAAEVGGGRIPWLAGIHDRGKDTGNPHAHVIFRDRDHETGKRVANLSAKGSTEQLRQTWERVANQALERAGHDARIDHRSLEAQGIAREAGIHVGPNVLAMEERGIRPKSSPQVTVNGRVIDWPKIDQGRTRLDRQAEIEAANDNREKERDGKGKGTAAVAASVPVQSEDTPAPPAAVSAAVQPAPDVSRLRLAIDRARQRLDALSTRLDQAFSRIKERFAAQERQPARRTVADFRRDDRPAECEPAGQLRRALDAFRRDRGPDRSGPER